MKSNRHTRRPGAAITPLTIDSYDEVMALWRQCEGIGLSDADGRENIAAYLERNPGLSFVARVDGTLAGAVLCGHDGRRGYLHHLAVHPRFRRQGIGWRLVERLDALRKVGIHVNLAATNIDLQKLDLPVFGKQPEKAGPPKQPATPPQDQ